MARRASNRSRPWEWRGSPGPSCGNHAPEAGRRGHPGLDILRYVASLAAAAAHEINNPLTVVVGYVQLLADEVDAAERGHIDEMLKAVSRIQEIVTRMARVTRVELTENVLYLPRDA